MRTHICANCGESVDQVNAQGSCSECAETIEEIKSTAVPDAREAPTPPRLRYARHGDCGPFYLVSDTNEIYGPRDVAIPDKHTRLAVIAEPTDLQAVVDEICACHFYAGGPEGKVAIKKVLEKYL